MPSDSTPRSHRSTETVEGVLDRFVFESEDSAWCVAKVKLDQRRTVSAVGNLFGARPGDTLRLTGRWVQDRRYGEQFEVERYVSVQPSTLKGMERYLGSGMVRGIGKVMAKRLVNRFGLETLEVIESRPERLTEVEGIGPVRSRRISEAWKEQREIQQVMLFLQTHGVSPGFAVKIFKQYGAAATRVVTENPFRLAADVHGIGFKSADAIASALGINADAPQRLEAGLVHALAKAADQGHVYLPRNELVERAVELLGVPAEAVDRALDAALLSQRLLAEARGASGAIYSRHLLVAERGLAQALRRLMASSPPPIDTDPKQACDAFEKRHGVTLSPGQRRAVATILTTPVVIVTGGPGTGKTTLVRALVEIFAARRRRVRLTAPTGRAAKRLAEASGHPAATIHRLLEFTPQEMRFERTADNPLETDVVIVDEVSMVDTVLGHQLVDAVPTGARLVLVGDADQLPSVGPGAVLADLISGGAIPAVRLRTVFRQAAASLIVSNAHRLLAGELPRLADQRSSRATGDFFFIDRPDPEELLSTLEHLVAERIPGRFGLSPARDIQVLTPMRRGPLGTASINRRLQALLNPGGAPVGSGTRGLRLGDKVMQLRNNYQLDVFNGDLGTLVSSDEEAGEVVVAVDDRTVRYDARDLDDLDLAYACSIHKSQGSEYACVVVVIHQQHYVMLQRNLLYTAMTRGKRLVVLLGQRRAVARAVRNHSPNRRYSGLAERLAEGLAADRGPARE